MNPYNVLVRPILSEKSNKVREKSGKYTFEVQLKATKVDIASAVTKLYDVKVDTVRTCITRDRSKRRGAQVLLPKKTKKAVVTLVDGAKIPLFEDQ